MWTPPERWPVDRRIKWMKRIERVKSFKWYGLLVVAAFAFAYAIHVYQPPHYLYRVFDAPNLPAIILMFVGIGGTWFALRTLKAIERQVDAQVNTERAWMEVEIELDREHGITEVTRGQQPTKTVVSLKAKWLNVGRTHPLRL